MSRFLVLAFALATLTGCGPDKREVTRSQLNQLADTWDGTDKFTADGTDPWGEPYTARVDKGPVNYTLTVRSNGPDKLPQNTDDIIVTRSKKHTAIGDAAGPAVEKLGEAAGRGVGRGGVEGIREGLFGKKKDADKKDADKKDADKKGAEKKDPKKE
jgi:hypothetical protein